MHVFDTLRRVPVKCKLTVFHWRVGNTWWQWSTLSNLSIHLSKELIMEFSFEGRSNTNKYGGKLKGHQVNILLSSLWSWGAWNIFPHTLCDLLIHSWQLAYWNRHRCLPFNCGFHFYNALQFQWLFMYSLASFIDIITVLEQSLLVKNWVVSKSAHVLLMFGLNAVITSPGFMVFTGEEGIAINAPCALWTLPYLYSKYIQNRIIFSLPWLPLWSLKKPRNSSSPSWIIAITSSLAALFPPLPPCIRNLKALGGL